jgi:YjbE family integral membrane protein
MEAFLIGLLQVSLINIVLSGDNAVVIALACRKLPPEQQKKAVFWGGFGAVVLRIVLTFVAVWLLRIPYVEIVGALLLLYIAIKLLRNDDSDDELKSGTSMSEAIKTIISADLIMSLDNVLAVAGAAHGDYLLIGLALVISIPLILWGSRLLMTLMNRFPVIVYLGAGLLGYTAGEMALDDKGIGPTMEMAIPHGSLTLPMALAAIVILAGLVMRKRDKDKPISTS